MSEINTIYFNGDKLSVAGGATVNAVLTMKDAADGHFIVVVNDEVVPKVAYDTYQLEDGDNLEVMTPITGG